MKIVDQRLRTKAMPMALEADGTGPLRNPKSLFVLPLKFIANNSLS
ncbi:hypothetical protein [Actinomycetospora straminea]|nr:hypothetical protein [Actinomycetospora straminea]MDD7936758.1 hypothetical protein [Actinomycetospora straminea]